MENFGKLKNAFNTILTEGISEKNDVKKGIFKKYIKMLKENKMLKTQFDVYNTIELMVESNEFKANEKIKKVLESTSNFDNKKLTKLNTKLLKLLEGVDLECDYENKILHENISNLIFSKDVDKYVDSLHETIQYTKTNTIKEDVKGNGVSNDILISVAVDKFNDRYSDLDESSKVIVKSILEYKDEDKEILFNDNITECITLINGKLKNEFKGDELSIKESLLAAKENLLGRNYDKNNFISDMSKILTLKQDLK